MDTEQIVRKKLTGLEVLNLLFDEPEGLGVGLRVADYVERNLVREPVQLATDQDLVEDKEEECDYLPTKMLGFLKMGQPRPLFVYFELFAQKMLVGSRIRTRTIAAEGKDADH